MEESTKKICKMSFLIIILIIIDQLIKFYIPNFIDYGSKEIINGILSFTYAENTGGAFSFGQSNIISIVIMNVIILGIVIKFMVSQIKRTDLLTNITICLVLAGGISNLLDRIFRSFVVDYIDFSLFKYAIFNLADIYVVLGWIVLVILTTKYTFKGIKTENKEV